MQWILLQTRSYNIVCNSNGLHGKMGIRSWCHTWHVLMYSHSMSIRQLFIGGVIDGIIEQSYLYRYAIYSEKHLICMTCNLKDGFINFLLIGLLVIMACFWLMRHIACKFFGTLVCAKSEHWLPEMEVGNRGHTCNAIIYHPKAVYQANEIYHHLCSQFVKL